MSSPGDLYLNQAHQGESRWWSWIMVFWFFILGWLAVQMILLSPIGAIASKIDPESAAALDEVAVAMAQDPEALQAMLIWGGVFMLTTLAGLIAWPINRYTNGTGKTIFGWITGIGVAGSFYSMFRLAPLMSDPEGNAVIGSLMGQSPLVYALFVLVFPASLIGLYLAYKYIHKRSLTSLHTAASKINWKRGLQAFFLTWAVWALFALILKLTGLGDIRANFQPKTFAIYALISITLIPLQSATEEIIFRGYLNQAFHRFLRNKWVVFTLTSLLFTAVHLANPEALEGAENGKLWLTMSGYFVFGFAACLLVWMDGGLESAIGLHAANNTFAAIFLNYEGSVLPTPSLFMTTPNVNIDMPITIISMVVIVLILYKLRPPQGSAA